MEWLYYEVRLKLLERVEGATAERNPLHLFIRERASESAVAISVMINAAKRQSDYEAFTGGVPTGANHQAHRGEQVIKRVGFWR